MRENFIFNLKQPCKNRGIKLDVNDDGSVYLDGIRYESYMKCEDYIISQSRKDIK